MSDNDSLLSSDYPNRNIITGPSQRHIPDVSDDRANDDYALSVIGSPRAQSFCQYQGQLSTYASACSTSPLGQSTSSWSGSISPTVLPSSPGTPGDMEAKREYTHPPQLSDYVPHPTGVFTATSRFQDRLLLPPLRLAGQYIGTYRENCTPMGDDETESDGSFAGKSEATPPGGVQRFPMEVMDQTAEDITPQFGTKNSPKAMRQGMISQMKETGRGHHVSTTFSKNLKTRVATQKGKDASDLRRKTKARFSCSMEGCDSTFTRNHNLQNHIKAHLGITDLPCKWCSRCFTTLPVRNRHEHTCLKNPKRQKPPKKEIEEGLKSLSGSVEDSVEPERPWN